MDLCLQLKTFKKGDLSIENYILRIKMNANHLVVVGQPIPSHDLVFYTLEVLDLIEIIHLVYHIKAYSSFF